jgi:hypothetical protein
MAVNTEPLDRSAARLHLLGMSLIATRRAKAIEHELHKRADDGAACADLAALLQE